jgi:hypothetical protein
MAVLLVGQAGGGLAVGVEAGAGRGAELVTLGASGLGTLGLSGLIVLAAGLSGRGLINDAVTRRLRRAHDAIA